jgi:hypothetical protein
MQPIDFGPYTTNLGTKKKDKLNCAGGQGFYTGGGNDILTNASFTIDDPKEPGGYSTYPSVMSGGAGNDSYQFKSDGWAFIADGGGGKDTVSFPKKSPFNPKLWYDDTIMSMVLVNDRDVLLSTTSLTDGGRANGIIFADPFGQYNKANKIEKVKFGNKKYSFKGLYKSQIKTAKSKKWGDYYTFSKSTFQELSEAGALDLSAFDDLWRLESGGYLDIAIHNNSLAI